MKVELIEKFNMSVGTVLVIRSSNLLKVGDEITDGNETYTIKGFMHPTGAFDETLISVIV